MGDPKTGAEASADFGTGGRGDVIFIICVLKLSLGS